MIDLKKIVANLKTLELHPHPSTLRDTGLEEPSHCAPLCNRYEYHFQFFHLLIHMHHGVLGFWGFGVLGLGFRV